MRTFWQKISSRKFLAAAVGVIMGLSMAFGLDQNIVNQVAGAVTALASVITYVIAEGRIDAAAVGEAARKVEDAREALKNGAD